MSANRDGKNLLSSQWLNGSLVIADAGISTGKKFYVDSGATYGLDADGYGVNPDGPMVTLNKPFTDKLVVANNGDIIYAMPGHAENLPADSAVDMDIAGVKIIGLGDGAARPTFTCTATTGDFKLAAASSIIENLLFLNDIDNSTGLLEVSGADCKVRDCEIREADAAKFADILLLTTAGAVRMEIVKVKIVGNAGDGAVSAISLVGTTQPHIHDCNIYGDFSTSVIDCATTLSTLLRIHDCHLWNADATGGADAIQCVLDTITGSTGIIGPNVNCHLGADDHNITGAFTGATFVVNPSGCQVTNAVGEKGMPINWTAATDA